MQDDPDQVTEAMGNRSDGSVVSEAYHQSTIDDLEDTSFVFDGGMGSLIENATHLTVALRRAFAAVDAGALFFARACSYPRDQILGGLEGGCRGPHFGNDLLRRIHSQARHLRQSFHRILVRAEQIRGLLIELTDPLLDQLQVVQGQSYESTVDRIEFGAGTQCIAQLGCRGT